MTGALALRRRALRLAALLMLFDCSAAPPPASPGAPRHAAAASDAHDEHTSALPQPDGLVVVLRIGAVRTVIERVTALTGLGGVVAAFADEALRAALGGSEMAGLMDRDAPIDLSVLAGTAIPARESVVGDVSVVTSFAAPPVETIERELGAGHRLVPLGNGLSRIERIASPEPTASDGALRTPPVQCLVALTPSTQRTRIVCSTDAAAALAMAPYLARTLVREPLARNVVSAQLAVSPARRRFGAWAQSQLAAAGAAMDAEVARDASAPWRHAPVREAITEVLRNVFASAATGLDGLGASAVVLTLGDEGASVRVNVDVDANGAPLVTALANTLRPQAPPPADQLERLLPGAVVYLSGAIDSAPIEPLLTSVIEIGRRIVTHEPTLDSADALALRAWLDAVAALDPSLLAGAFGFDGAGAPWVTLNARSAHHRATAWVTGAHAMVQALMRPRVATMVAHLLQRFDAVAGDLQTLREVPEAELPPGVWAVRTVPREARPPHTRHGHRVDRTRASTAPVNAVRALVMAPDGDDLWIAYGVDAVALLARWRANTTPALAASAFGADGAALRHAVIPAALATWLRAMHPGAVTTVFERLVAAMPDHGGTPITVRVGAVDLAPRTRFALEINVPAPSLASVGASMNTPPSSASTVPSTGSGSPAP